MWIMFVFLLIIPRSFYFSEYEMSDSFLTADNGFLTAVLTTSRSPFLGHDLGCHLLPK